MELSFKKGILLVTLGGIKGNIVRDLDVLVDLIKDDGFSNVLIEIKRNLKAEELKRIEKIKNFNNVLII